MYILADIGGTKTRIAASDDLEKFGEPVVRATMQEYDAELDEIVQTAKKLSGGQIDRVIMGKPLWNMWPAFERDLQTRLDAPLHIENDVALVGLGEWKYGAGKGASIFVYITVSTGVNGVRIIDGKIDVSKQGFEIGGQYLSMGDAPQTLENLVSGTAVAKRFSVASPKELGKDNPAWDELARTLAFGVHNSILHWSPDRVVIGGSMVNDIGISVERVREHVVSIMKKFPNTPEITHSKLGDFGGLWGGMARLKQMR